MDYFEYKRALSTLEELEMWTERGDEKKLYHVLRIMLTTIHELSLDVERIEGN